MTRIKFATATALVALATAGFATGVQAADLILEPRDDVFTDVTHPSFYVLLYGGVAFRNNVDISGSDYEYGPGPAIGAAVGVNIVEPFSVELDLFHTHRAFFDDPDLDWEDTISTTSLMVNGKVTLALTDTFDVYAGAGVGGIWLNYTYYGDSSSGVGAGYQFMVGASANVTENIAIFGELRHQNSFSPIAISGDNGDYDVQAPVNAALVGVKLSM
jgi:opacity protein-like surface antigen